LRAPGEPAGVSRLRSLVAVSPLGSLFVACAAVATVGTALTLGGSTAATLRAAALSVVLWGFAAGFWAGPIAERRL